MKKIHLIVSIFSELQQEEIEKLRNILKNRE